MNVLHLQPELNLTCGISKSIYLLIKNTKDQISHHIICNGGDGVARYHELHVQLAIKKRFVPALFNYASLSIYVFKYCINNQIDIVHSHHRMFDLIAFGISKLINIKTVTSVHSKVYKFRNASYKSELLIAVSNAVKAHLIKYFKKSENIIMVINNYADPSDITFSRKREEIRDELSIEESEIALGYIGRFDKKEKGVDLLLHAFSKTYEKLYNTKLVLIGNGKDEPFVRNYIKQNCYLPISTLKPQENIYEFLNALDIIILPSKIDPFPIILLEAGIIGKSVIASNVDGIPEIIENEVDGLLFENGNIQSLVSCIIRLTDSAELRARLGNNLNKKINTKYSANIVSKKYLDMYTILKNS